LNGLFCSLNFCRSSNAFANVSDVAIFKSSTKHQLLGITCEDFCISSGV
jgi:hypothetical protein